MTQPAPDPAAAIAASAAAIDRALMDADPQAAASHFTADAVLGESGADDVRGREAIQAFLAHGDTVRRVTFHRLHRDELLVLGAWAVELARFDETKALHATPDQLVHERGRTMTLWRRDDDGAWRIHRLVISDLPPLPAT